MGGVVHFPAPYLKCLYRPLVQNNLLYQPVYFIFRKFVCELCGKSFNSDHNLKEHTVYVHRDERKFKCTKCEKSFKLKNALIRHQSVSCLWGFFQRERGQWTDYYTSPQSFTITFSY